VKHNEASDRLLLEMMMAMAEQE